MLQSLFFIYLSLGIFAYFFADRLIFQPQPSSYRDSQDIIKLTTADHVQISAIYLPNPQATYTLLHSHGNAEDLGDLRPILERLRPDFSIFAYDYRGYGTSQGHPSEQHAYTDIEAAYAYLTQILKVPPDRIIAHGRSVGGGPSVELAGRRAIAGLILESAFVSAFRVMTQISLYPFDKFANLSKIGAVRCPVLVIHGTHDQVIPFWHGQTLYNRANPPKQFYAVEGADHNNLIEVGGAQYFQTLREFSQTQIPHAMPK